MKYKPGVLLVSTLLLAAAALWVVCPLAPRQAYGEGVETLSMTATTSGTVALSRQFRAKGGSNLVCWTMSWTSDSAGAVVSYSDDIQGTIERVSYNPDESAAPSDNYDMVINDQDGLDVLAGTGANLDLADETTTIVTAGDGVTTRPMVVLGRLTLAVTNAGDSKLGLVRIYARQ